MKDYEARFWKAKMEAIIWRGHAEHYKKALRKIIAHPDDPQFIAREALETFSPRLRRQNTLNRSLGESSIKKIIHQ